ncbi:putative 2,4-dienoyl-CoA reductase ((2E)-enoyl-CoA-producing) [Helianthus anomalus]
MESPFKGDILKGKVGLLTGGGSGIGFEIAAEMGKHGASIAIMGRRNHVLHSAVSALQSHGIHAIGIEGDVRNKEDCARVIETTIKQFGKLDILVNAAAGNFLVPSEDLSPNGFRTVIDIDAVGAFTMCHEALEHLKNGGSCTRSLALEWGTDYGIRVNGIAPGPIDDTTGTSKLVPEKVLLKRKQESALYRMGKKWDIAMVALYLASDGGNYVNDGGIWLSSPRHISKEAVKQVSKTVEKKSRDAPVGIPKSNL